MVDYLSYEISNSGCHKIIEKLSKIEGWRTFVYRIATVKFDKWLKSNDMEVCGEATIN